MKLNNNKKSVKISRSLFMLYAVLVCGIVFALPLLPQMIRWWSLRTFPRSSFR